MRYLLISSLIMEKNSPKPNSFLEKHKEEDSAHILYSRALVLFQTSKNKKAADMAILDALASNEFIPPLLLSPDLIPDGDLPDSYSAGSFEEAVIYCASNYQCWYLDVALFQRLKSLCSMHLLAMATERHEQEEAERRGRLASKRDQPVKGRECSGLELLLEWTDR